MAQKITTIKSTNLKMAVLQDVISCSYVDRYQQSQRTLLPPPSRQKNSPLKMEAAGSSEAMVTTYMASAYTKQHSS